MKEFNIKKEINQIEVITDKTSKIDLIIVIKGHDATNNAVLEKGKEEKNDIRQINHGLLISNNPYNDSIIRIELSKDMILDNFLTVYCNGYITIESECKDVSFDIMNTSDTEQIVDNIDFRGKCNSLEIRAHQDSIVFLTNVVADDEINIYSVRGNIHMYDVKSPYMYIDSNKGSIFLKDVILDMFQIGSFSGNINVEDCIFNRQIYPLSNKKIFINTEGNIDIKNMNCQVIPRYWYNDNIFANKVSDSKFNLELPYVYAIIVGDRGKITVK